jgi:large subunit ribosomal protein L6
MSRVGKNPIPIPTNTKVKLEGERFVAEGPKGSVAEKVPASIDVEIADGEVRVARRGSSNSERAQHGLVRALLANAVTGASAGFTKELEIIGVGYRAEVKGREVHFTLGYSHPIVLAIPEGIDIEVDKNNRVKVHGPRKQQVGQVAADIRSLRKPEPYKGKGIRYADEQIRRKVGKAGAGA